MYLLDTDVLSFTSPTSRLDGEAVQKWRRWVRANQDDLFLSVVTIMEIRFGVERLRARGASRKHAALAKWLLVTETVYRDRINWVSPEIANRAGELLAQAASAGTEPGAEDAIIAATADLSDCTLVTRNQRHMAVFGIDHLNPLTKLPG